MNLDYTSRRIAVESRVRGRNRWTGEEIRGQVESIERSDLDGKVYVAVRPFAGVPCDRSGGLALALADDVTVIPTRCRRPEPADDPTHKVVHQPQGSGYRCRNCGQTIWYIRDGRAEGGERLTHDAWLSLQPSRAF